MNLIIFDAVLYFKFIKIICQQSLQQSEYTHHYHYFYKILFTWQFEFCFFIAKSANVIVNHVLKKVDEYIDEKRDDDDMETRT
jgi:hypothetical protein